LTPPLMPAAAGYLEKLAEELDVPPGRYDEAKRRYKSVGEWLGRDESTLKDYSPDVYVQGSFRLGTPIRPINDAEHYDIDLVCELDIATATVTQQQLKAMLGLEMQAYAKAHGMKEASESRRCWTLDYAEGAQFHLDALPAVPDAGKKRLRLETRGLSTTWVETAIAITDIDHPQYETTCTEWPHSNPKGFTKWFRSRMTEVFERQRSAMALEAKANVEDIPSYRVKTPLQQAVQILKRHRDIRFAGDPDNKPISVILTTLAGLSYGGEASVGYALQAILAAMPTHIETRGGVIWIPNPTDPEENFADRWQQHPERKTKFFEWLEAARSDFSRIGALGNRETLVEEASKVMGGRVARGAAASLAKPVASGASLFQRATSVFMATHRKPAPWQRVRGGTVSIAEGTMARDGFRTRRFYHDGAPLPKNASLFFKAVTDVPWPYDVHWQVVNTGPEASAVPGGLRGGFDAGTVERGSILRKESTSYTGTHTIECFIVKNGYLVARSGAFIVNIA
jgi:Adenylyl/Guanylyl and SMODS C-terminal sensor domain